MGTWSLAAVIPAYNSSLTIGRTLESVLSQRRPPDEIVVVDDGSSDDTAEVVRSYGEEISVIRKTNGGVSSARNLGVQETTSDFVAFLDSDDVWHEEHLARMEHAIQVTNGEAGLYFSDLELDPPPRGAPSGVRTVWQWSGFSIKGDHEVAQDGREWFFRDVQPVMIQASVVSRQAYEAVGGCNLDLVCTEDTHLFFKLGLETSICAVAGVGGRYHGATPGSLTETFSGGNETYWRYAAQMYGDVLESRGDRLTSRERRILSWRLADAHWVLARINGHQSAGAALGHLRQAVRLRPSLVPRRLAHRLARTARLG
jgi:glycosyltransferase involved in cell wall biosynthesis